jgi:hypothetical protein
MSLDTSTGQGQKALQEEQAQHDSFLDERGMNDATQASVGTEMNVEQMTEGEQDMAGERHDQTVSRDDAQIVDGEVYEEDGTYVGSEEEVDFEEDDMTSGNTEEVVEEAQAEQAAAQATGSQPQPTTEAAEPTGAFSDGQDPVTIPDTDTDFDAQKPLDMVAESSGPSADAESAANDMVEGSRYDGQDVDNTTEIDINTDNDNEIDNDFIDN